MSLVLVAVRLQKILLVFAAVMLVGIVLPGLLLGQALLEHSRQIHVHAKKPAGPDDPFVNK